jgi:hypothetical protein
MEGFPECTVDLSNKYVNLTIRKLKGVAQSKKIPIVSETWIDVCYEFNCCLQHSYFIPSNPYTKILYSSEG